MSVISKRDIASNYQPKSSPILLKPKTPGNTGPSLLPSYRGFAERICTETLALFSKAPDRRIQCPSIDDKPPSIGVVTCSQDVDRVAFRAAYRGNQLPDLGRDNPSVGMRSGHLPSDIYQRGPVFQSCENGFAGCRQETIDKPRPGANRCVTCDRAHPGKIQAEGRDIKFCQWEVCNAFKYVKFIRAVNADNIHLPRRNESILSAGLTSTKFILS